MRHGAVAGLCILAVLLLVLACCAGLAAGAAAPDCAASSAPAAEEEAPDQGLPGRAGVWHRCPAPALTGGSRIWRSGNRWFVRRAGSTGPAPQSTQKNALRLTAQGVFCKDRKGTGQLFFSM